MGLDQPKRRRARRMPIVRHARDMGDRVRHPTRIRRVEENLPKQAITGPARDGELKSDALPYPRETAEPLSAEAHKQLETIEFRKPGPNGWSPEVRRETSPSETNSAVLPVGSPELKLDMATAAGLNYRRRPENTRPCESWRRERNWLRTFSTKVSVFRRVPMAVVPGKTNKRYRFIVNFFPLCRTLQRHRLSHYFRRHSLNLPHVVVLN